MELLILYILILCIFITTLVIYIKFYNRKLPLLPVIIGGSNLINDNGMYDIDINNKKRIFIPDKEKLVIDGHNMIHDMNYNKKLTENIFNNTILELNNILLEAFPTQDIHFVIKNTKGKKNDKNTYLEKIVEFSNSMPNITFHLAYDKGIGNKGIGNKGIDNKGIDNKELHHIKARDDYLTIYLSKGAYMISKDRYRDFKYFKNIQPFNHYAIKNGLIILTEYINPEIDYRKLEKPNLGNHFIYKIIDRTTLDNMKISNGSIYIDDDSKYSKIYLSR